MKKIICCILLSLFIVLPLKAEISNQTLAILVNVNDPESIEIANYYQKARLIPNANVIYLNFKSGVGALTEEDFTNVEAQLRKKVKNNIQAYVLAWRKPWRVACMSITSAFSLGFDKKYCAKGCKLTKTVKYFNSQSKQPYTDFKIRPSMMLSASSVEGVKKLIDRGVAADYTRPIAAAYLLSTSDKQRNVRAVYYPAIKKELRELLDIELVKTDAIKQANNVMFYFTGVKSVKWLDQNQYFPGAIADHLTSAGGKLFNSGQMSLLKWIDAGVTGSYGTVVEPCNFLQKFPHPGILLEKYMSGDTLLEAYWKSVQMPGQGVFVGEPLAAPYKGCKLGMSALHKVHFLSGNISNYVVKNSKKCD